MIDRLLETVASEAIQAVVPVVYKGCQIKTVLTGFGISFAIGLTEDLLILGRSDKVVKSVIDMSLSDPTAESPMKGKCNFLLHLNLRDSLMFKKYMESRSARMIQSLCQSNRSGLEAIIEVFRQDLEIPEGQDVLEGISRVKKMPYCPEGGEYSYSSEGGVVCSVHGSNDEPEYVNSLPEEGRMRKLFDNIGQITASLEFTEHGIMTVLRVDNPVHEPGTGGIFKRLWRK